MSNTSKQQLPDLFSLIELGQTLMAVQSPLTERERVLLHLNPIALKLALPLFYWNQGYTHLQQVLLSETGAMVLQSTSYAISDGLLWLVSHEGAGIFIFEGVLAPNAETGRYSLKHIASLTNLAFQLRSGEQVLLCLEAYVELPQSLVPFMPVLSNPYPTSEQVRSICLQQFQGNSPHICLAAASQKSPGNSSLSKLNETALLKLIQVCLAIPQGELAMVLKRLGANVTSLEELSEAVLAYKKSKFHSKGVEFIAQPDVPKAAGLELLDAYLARCAALLRPEARLHNLNFTKGILLWGPPGTGKSLSAKLAAQKMGVPLLAADWGGLRGATAYESRQNLQEFLEICDILGEGGLILYFDDFDKGFAGFDADNDGGISRQMAGKLLTWMQEHTSKVLVMATINRLDFLPPELIRRFEDNIFFVDLPHAGARQEIFKLHLQKYCPGLDFTDSAWRKLLDETNLLTPAEIGNLVKRAAVEAFYQNSLHLDSDSLANKKLEISVDDLLKQRYLFTPSLIREEDQIVSIRNQASYARPANAPDTSRWAKKTRPLFGVAVN